MYRRPTVRLWADILANDQACRSPASRDPRIRGPIRLVKGCVFHVEQLLSRPGEYLHKGVFSGEWHRLGPGETVDSAGFSLVRKDHQPAGEVEGSQSQVSQCFIG